MGNMGDRSSNSFDDKWDVEWCDEEPENDLDGKDVHIHSNDADGNEAGVEAEGNKGVDLGFKVEDVFADENYDPRSDGYRSGNDSALEEAELACLEDNPTF